MKEQRRRPATASKKRRAFFSRPFAAHSSQSRRAAYRPLRFRALESRQLLAVGPQLIGITPNDGELLEPSQIRHVAPQELTFRFDEGQTIDAATLGGIQIVRSGQDDVFGNGNDVPISPGYVGIGERPNEVIVRFAGVLPDDVYRITVYGAGASPLRNVAGDPFNDGVNRSLDFELDLGVQVIAVVPQPTGRGAGGVLTQARDQIVVYFNDDDLYSSAVTTGQLATDPTVVDPRFYQLIFTNSTVFNTDDQTFLPTQISYDPVTDKAVLTFATDLALLPTGPGTYRLRIGTDEGLPPAPVTITLGDTGDSFDSASDLGLVGTRSLIVSGAIAPQFFPLEFPGANDEPGHRDVPVQDHLLGGPDGTAGIETMFYNFRSDYGSDPLGNPLYNAITAAQKDLARRIFEIYGYYIGIQFVESASQGLTIVTGDLRALDPEIPTGPGGVAGLAGGGMAIMDNAETWNDDFGGNWFSVAFHEIGHLLGLGHTYELPVMTVMGDDPVLAYGQTAEPVFPGDYDIVHGLYLHRPEGNDIDLYTFTVEQQGLFTAETIAERLATSSSLDTVISLYRSVGNGFELVARNDDYFSEDSFVAMELTPGTYVVAVSASGNKSFDPTVEGTGLYGTSDGPYQLRLNFRPLQEAAIVDATGTAMDGDGDGAPGGVYNFWFQVQTQAHTKFVDKSAIGGATANGSLANPYRTLTAAFAAAQFGDVVRVVANGGADGNVNTVGDNLPFLVGFDELNRPLEDGATVQVPRGVTLMVDAGAVFKSRKGAIEVGSTAQGVDRSGGALQVLGTPTLPVYFTSYNDEAIGRDTNPTVPQTAVAGDWGGILFRNDLDRASPSRIDYEARGIFLNYVNHADMRYGGGRVTIGSLEQAVSPVQMVDARPTITFNSITRSADAALSASPNSFEETNFHSPRFQTVAFTSDYDRVGPEIHGNALFNNTINGLFIRVRTPAGDALRPMTVAGRFDDTDVVHVISENLVVQGTPGGALYDDKTGRAVARLDARLAIDPGIVVKLNGAHIQVDVGAQLIAEGTDGHRVVFTALYDDTFGAGGNFDTTSNGSASPPAAGNWGGIYFGHASTGSIDYALIRYAGGVTRLQSSFAGFNAVEIHQADVRVTNSILEYNAAGTGGQAPANRFGLMSHQAATIFVRGAQPVIAQNIIRHNAGPAININVNALNDNLVSDFGRSTGPVGFIEGGGSNYGPLVLDNRLLNNAINGMVVRGGTLTTQSIWDDTSIVHVLYDEVIVPDFHTSGGLLLKSAPNESLVVKLSGAQAGFTAKGRPLDIDDRIGGVVHIIGQPGSPVVLTSLADDSVGAGMNPDGTPNTDTNNDGGASQPTPGDWRSILIDQYSHDRNVAVYTERESPLLDAPGSNSTPEQAEYLGALAPNEKSGDDNLRLGFVVHGYISQPGDVDVYSFQASAGTEVWLDIDRTGQALDTVVELVDRNGVVVARSDNSLDESNTPSLLGGNALLMQQLPPFGGRDYFTVNPKDAGMRVALPDAAGTSGLYYVRVRSSSGDLSDLNGGLTSGAYQLQVRLREIDEFAGSNVRFADIRFATNGIEVLGQPIHSPLLGEAAEDATQNNTETDAQDIGNLMVSDRAAISVAGILDASTTDVDFYRFEINYTALQGPNGDANSNAPAYAGTVFDVDYSDGLARGEIVLSVFDEQGRLILVARDADVRDDRPVTPDGDMDDLSRGSLGPLDPFLGTTMLQQGVYYVAVSAGSRVAQELDQFLVSDPSNPLVRLEPINSTIRIVEDHIDSSGGSTALDPIVPTLMDEDNVVPYFLGDVVLFVSQDTGGIEQSRVLAVNPFTGAVEVIYSAYGRDVGDLAMLYDGRLGGTLHAFSLDVEDGDPQDSESGNFLLIDPATGAVSTIGDDGIVTYENDTATPPAIIVRDTGVQFEAMTFLGQSWLLAIGYRGDMGEPAPRAPNGVSITENILYRFNPLTGAAVDDPNVARVAGAGTDAIERGEILTSAVIRAAAGVSINDGLTFRIDDGIGVTTFEFDTGPEAAVNFNTADPNQRILDGEFFMLDGRRVEFETGRVIVVTGDGSIFQDGSTLTVQDNLGRTRTFEFNSDTNPVGAGNIEVKFDANTNATQMAAAIEAAINSQTGATFNAVASVRGTWVSVANDRMIDLGPTMQGVQLNGEFGVTVGAIAVSVEDTFTPQQVRDAIVAAVNGANVPATSPGVATFVRASTANTRVNFSGATTADFSGVNDFVTVRLTSGTNDPQAVVVPFLVGDTADVVAQRIRNAINNSLSPLVTATAAGATVYIVGAASAPTAGAPLTAAGDGPGGRITGMATVGGEVYAVSDEGGLWRINNPLSANATAQYVGTSAADLRGIRFAGLTAGPANVEGGRYADMLFGISQDGVLYAFNTRGVLQPVFLDGASSIETGATSVQGLAFSSLDTNLWHITDRRDTDAGHGINYPFDGSREAEEGGLSFYFGRDYTNPNLADYNTPGGAHGSIVTNSFDLSDYAPKDEPFLYFNYLLRTENANYNPDTNPTTLMRDSFRVYIMHGETGEWVLLGTNNSFRDPNRTDEFDDPNVQEFYDNTGTWRQVRISLGDYAGLSDLRLRFDFTTAGSLDFGNPDTTGSELRALPGADLRDGDSFTIDGTTFEFDSGCTVVLPPGAAISDGDTVSITGALSTVVFEFDTDGQLQTAGATAVSFSPDEAAADIAARLRVAILNNGPFDVIPHLNAYRVNLEDALAASVAGGTGVAVEGMPGVVSGVRVRIHEEMTADDVADAIADAMAAAFAGYNQQIVAQDGSQLTEGQTITVSSAAGSVVIELDTGYVLRTPASGGQGMVDGQTFTITNNATSVVRVFEFDDDSSLTDLTHIQIQFDSATTATALGARIAAAVSGAGLGLSTQHLGGGAVHVGGTVDHVLVDNSNLAVSGQPGVQTPGAVAMAFIPSRSFTADQTADALAAIINGAGIGITATADGRRVNLVGDDVAVDASGTAVGVVAAPTDTVKRFGNTVKVIGHTVTDQGKLLLADTLFGDEFGAFNSPLRAQNNAQEGVYVDDLIIGFAERGEMVTASTANTDFRNNPQLPDNQILQGPYQLEIRRAAEYGTPVEGGPGEITLLLTRSFDTNDRLTQAVTLVAPAGAEIASGQTFTLGDGVDGVTFVFQSVGAAGVAETGDVIASSTSIGLVAGTTGSFAARADLEDGKDVDFFAFDLNAGDTISIDIDARGLSPASPLDSVLRLFDSTGVELLVSDDDPAPAETGSVDSFLEFTALTAGRYYVGVSGYSNFSYNPFVAESGFGSNSTGWYEIEFLLNGGGQTSSGMVVIPYSVEDTAAEVANLIAAAVMRPEVQLVLDVQASSNPNSARVELSGSVVVGAGFSGSLREANDTLAEAVDSGIAPAMRGAFRARGQIGDAAGLVAPNLDVDLIRLELGVGDTITIDIDADELDSPLDSVVRLFDESGVELAYSDDDPAPGEASTLDSYLRFTVSASGVYYVGVSGYSNFNYNPVAAGSGQAGSTGFYQIEITRGAATAAGLGVIFHDEVGDVNRFRDQGQLIIESNFITNSAEYGIVVDAGARGASPDSPEPHQGPVRVFGNTNQQRLTAGATIANNVLAFNGSGGIHFSGDTNTANGQFAPVPYGRIINNTIFGMGGGDVGIKIDQNASPTVLNNIMANLGAGLDIDATSQSSVLGGLLFQGNGVNSNAGLGDHAIALAPGEPLFVDPAARNFYLNVGSRAIDSAVKSLQDRPAIVQVRQPLGIASSPLLAPEFDVYGLLRVDDPSMTTPSGLGETVFIDRGAIDRTDFEGPLAALTTPADGDGDTFVQSNDVLAAFVVQLNDAGVGVADGTVDGSKVRVEKDGVLLVQGQEYTFRYDETNDQIRITAGAGIWAPGTYRIVLDNSIATGIKDNANNPLQANQLTGSAEFTIQLGGGADYGDAPDPYPTLRPDGASHVVVQGFHLGLGVDADSNGKPSALANADAFDDGVTFDTDIFVVGQGQVTVRASAPGRLDAWIDFNRNGVWEAGEQIFSSRALVAGPNTLTFTVPSGAVGGETLARFRFSTAGGLAPGGAAPDGEVEDYRVVIKQATWQNPNNRLDVNGDGVVSSQDALQLANFLYFNGQRPVPPGPGAPPFPVAPPPFYDVNGDNFVTTQDALLVVTYLRSLPPPAPPAPQTLVELSGSSSGAEDPVLAASPVPEQKDLSPDELASAVFFLEETASPSTTLGPGANADGGTRAADQTTTSAESDALPPAAVDQVMADAADDADFNFLASDFVGSDSAASSPLDDAGTVDDFFAQLDATEELAVVAGSTEDGWV